MHNEPYSSRASAKAQTVVHLNFQFALKSMLVNRLLRYPCGVARISSHAQLCLARLRCSISSTSQSNGHHNSSYQQPDESSRALPDVAWGLAYHDEELGIHAASPQSDDKLAPYRDLDAIVVLGGGQTGPDSLPPWVERRLDTTLSLQRLQTRPCSILSLGGGTPHKGPYLDARGFVVHEATACARYLMERGAPASSLLKEVSSYDTVGNAYFSLTIHALPARWRRLAVVTSDFHMPRSAALFASMYRLVGRELFGSQDTFQLVFVAASDAGVFEPEVLQARKAKEAAARSAWLSTASALTSLSELHAWLHATHLCYAVPRQHEFGVGTFADPKLLGSY